jgi:hypothetical protein
VERLAQEHEAFVRDHAGEAVTRFALFRSMEWLADFLPKALKGWRGQMGVVLGEVNAGAGRNRFLDAAADLAEQAAPGQVLLTQQVTDILKSLDVLEVDTQYLGPRELSGMNRATGILRCGSHAEGGEEASLKSRQMDLMLMQAREESKRERERNQRTARFMIGCFATFFLLVVLGLVAAVLLRLGEPREGKPAPGEEAAVESRAWMGADPASRYFSDDKAWSRLEA